MPDSENAQPVPSARSRWFALAALVLPVLLVSMDLSVLYLAVPHISADLTPSSNQMLWILDIYGFVLAGLLIVMGSLGDRIGRRRLLLAGASLFGVASLLAAFAPSPEFLIASRALMGVGGATLMPSTLALIRNIFHDPEERTRAIGIWTAAFAGGGVLGPVVGGVLLSHFDWGSVFLINVPVIITLLVVAPKLVPEHRNDEQSGFDLVGAALSLAAVLAFVYALKKGAEEGLWSVSSGSFLLLSLILLVVFFAQQRSTHQPLIDFTLFRRRKFVAGILAVTLGMLALTGPTMYLAQYLQLVLSMSPLTAALWMAPLTFASMAGAMGATVVVARWGLPRTLFVGFLLASGGLAITATTPSQNGLAIVLIGGALLGAGVTTIMSLSTDVVVAAAPIERAGAASALSETGSELGAALGIALTGTLGTVIYRSSLTLPAELPEDLHEVAAQTLGAAIAVADTLTGSTADALRLSARQAFTSGFTTAAGVGAIMMFALGVLVPWLMRSAPVERDIQTPVIPKAAKE
ncbi:Major facilitator superfamily MFS_1 [Devosia sp. LC5]|uniref:MFS transporter n=1 Tax=Devosia sp. LC5 TaxID=1502724 RepID=UPI0004E3294E|nr:MFS transporter [Devosia sp. LC5]KFC64436.1 Major facilitator superfamily MFS_1 [Devosia sp. LC5]